MRKDDRIRLRHMLEAAREAVSFTQNCTRSDLNSDRMLTLSLVKCIEIIGEAAARITKESRRKYQAIPWPNIIAMRNRLIHAYFDSGAQVHPTTLAVHLKTQKMPACST